WGGTDRVRPPGRRHPTITAGIPMNKVASIVVVVAFLNTGGPGRAQERGPGGAEQLQRLSHLRKVWGAGASRPPLPRHQDIDWDAALVKALPRVEAAKSPEEFAAAVQGMLDALGDPATRVARTAALPKPAGPGTDPKATPGDKKFFTTIGDGVLAIDLR